MLHLASVCVGLLAVLGGDASPSPRDLQTYEALKVKAGKDPQAQVKLAVWCEAHGLDAERLKHLAQAVLADPANATARGLLGLVPSAVAGNRRRQIAERVKADDDRAAGLAEYNGRRARLAEKERNLRSVVERLKAREQPQAAFAAQVKGESRAGAGARQPRHVV